MSVLTVGGASLHVGDCLDVLRSLPSESVHTCVTSPPYLGLRNYQCDGQIGLEGSPAEYVGKLVDVFREVRRVLRKDATCWINLGDCVKSKQLQGIPWRVAFALQADGWILRQEIVWAKPNPLPESVRDRPTRAHEQVFLLAKSPTYFFDAEAVKEPSVTNFGGYGERVRNVGGRIDGLTRTTGSFGANGSRNIRSVWNIATRGFSGAHFACMPPELAERCIKAGTSERGCCAKCGAPWARVVEKGELVSSDGRQGSCGVYDQQGQGTSVSRSKEELGRETSYYALAKRETKHIGWRPSCACDAGTVPAVVLDCFGGAATTSLVANRLGRRSVYIDLNPAYRELAAERLRKEAPLFADAA